MTEYVGMSKAQKYGDKVWMGNSRNRIKQTTSIQPYISTNVSKEQTQSKFTYNVCRVV